MDSQHIRDSLLQRWRSGDQRAAEELYERYAARVWELAKAQIGLRLGRRIDPEDVVQSVFRTFFRRTRAGEYSIDRSGTLWQLLAAIAMNKVRRKARFHTAKRRDVRVEVYDESVEHPRVLDEIPEHDSAAALLAELDELLDGLQHPEPEIVRLCLQGYSTTEIGEQIGCSRWTVRRVLDRVGQRLQRRKRNATVDPSATAGGEDGSSLPSLL